MDEKVDPQQYNPVEFKETVISTQASSHNKKLKWLLIVLAVLIIIALVLGLLLLKNNFDTENTEFIAVKPRVTETRCMDSDKRCEGRLDGSSCTTGVWCDETGKVCGGQICDGMGTGSCLDGKCVDREDSREKITATSEIDTSVWEEYVSKDFGFSFRHDPNLKFQSKDLSLLDRPDVGGINRTEYFIELNEIQPPKVLFGVNPVYEKDPDASPGGVYPDYFSVWVMENNSELDLDEWYDRYVYFPIGFSKSRFDQFEKLDISVDGVEGEYIVFKDVVDQRLLLVSTDRYMFLIHINESSSIDKEILSTFRFN